MVKAGRENQKSNKHTPADEIIKLIKKELAKKG